MDSLQSKLTVYVSLFCREHNDKMTIQVFPQDIEQQAGNGPSRRHI